VDLKSSSAPRAGSSDHLTRKSIDPSAVGVVVLDEADQMFDSLPRRSRGDPRQMPEAASHAALVGDLPA